MKHISILTVTTALGLAVAVGPALAGKPNNPGGHGTDTISVGARNGEVGSAASDPAEGRSKNGENVDKARNDDDSKPNPANDNGGGND